MWRSGFLCSQTPRSRATSNSNSRYLHIQQSTHFPYCISLAASKFSRSITNSDSAVLRLVYASKVRPGANLPLFAFQKNYVIAALPFVTRSLTLSFEANGTNSDREKGYVHPIGERPGCYLSIVDMKCMHPSRKQVPLYPWRWYRIRYMCKVPIINARARFHATLAGLFRIQLCRCLGPSARRGADSWQRAQINSISTSAVIQANPYGSEQGGMLSFEASFTRALAKFLRYALPSSPDGRSYSRIGYRLSSPMEFRSSLPIHSSASDGERFSNKLIKFLIFAKSGHLSQNTTSKRTAIPLIT